MKPWGAKQAALKWRLGIIVSWTSFLLFSPRSSLAGLHDRLHAALHAALRAVACLPGRCNERLGNRRLGPGSNTIQYQQ